MSTLVELVAVAGPRGPAREPLRARLLAIGGGRAEIRSLPRDGLAEMRLWAVSTRDGVALKEL
ncbi:hypothetical protein [Nannocystis pusilla]|uniref:hypothetical protein n=1 Tax=Nannocystis pusilla TaxID=889268 RepID=UPI003DA58ED1